MARLNFGVYIYIYMCVCVCVCVKRRMSVHNLCRQKLVVSGILNIEYCIGQIVIFYSNTV